MKDYQQYKRISHLIAGEIIGILEPGELDELEAWIGEHPDNKALYLRIKNASGYHDWKSDHESNSNGSEWVKFYRSVQKQKLRYRIRMVYKYAAIAVFCLMVAGGSYFLLLKPARQNPPELQAQTFKPGSAKATLILNNGQSVVLDTPEKVLLKENDGTTIQKTEGLVSYSNQPEHTSEEIIYNTISIPRGGEYVVILSDGTKVYLNSITELKYPVSFQGNVREVELSGEALFEVAPDKSRPFIVKTGNIRTEALGTVFNVNAYGNSGEIVATLVEGKIRVETTDKHLSQILQPNDQAVFDQSANSLNVRKVDVKLYTAWKDGEFIFRNEQLSDIMETLTRWYTSDVQFQDPSLETLHFSGSLDRYGDIQPILDIIQSTSKVDIEIVQNNIIFKRKK